MKKTKKKTRDITTYNKRVEAVMDTTNDLFDRVTRKDQASLGVMVMSSAMTNLFHEGYCQHQVLDMYHVVFFLYQVHRQIYIH